MLQSTVVFSMSRCGMAHDRQQHLAQVSIFWSMCNTGHPLCRCLIVVAGVANTRNEPEGNYQLLKAVGMSSLTQHESYCPCICFSVDIWSSLSAKPAKPLQWSKGTTAWGEKEDQVGSSRMKHMLEEKGEKICTLCNL